MSNLAFDDEEKPLFVTEGGELAGSELTFFSIVLILTTLYAKKLWDSGMAVSSKRQSQLSTYSSILMAFLCVLVLIPIPAVTRDRAFELNSLSESSIGLSLLIRMSFLVYGLTSKFARSRLIRSLFWLLVLAGLLEFLNFFVSWLLITNAADVPDWDSVANAFETFSYFVLLAFQVAIAYMQRGENMAPQLATARVSRSSRLGNSKPLKKLNFLFGPRMPYIIVTLLLATHEVLFLVIEAIVAASTPADHSGALEIFQAIYHRSLMLLLTSVVKDLFTKFDRNLVLPIYAPNAFTEMPGALAGKAEELAKASSIVQPQRETRASSPCDVQTPLTNAQLEPDINSLGTPVLNPEESPK